MRILPTDLYKVQVRWVSGFFFGGLMQLDSVTDVSLHLIMCSKQTRDHSQFL